MWRLWTVLSVIMLAGCASTLPRRQAELAPWVGQPETNLVAAFGAPTRVYDSGTMKFLTYEDLNTVITQGSGPFYFGPGPGGPTGFPGAAYTGICATTFTVAGGVIKAVSLQGAACG